jgi:hypothetical protein
MSVVKTHNILQIPIKGRKLEEESFLQKSVIEIAEFFVFVMRERIQELLTASPE